MWDPLGNKIGIPTVALYKKIEGLYGFLIRVFLGISLRNPKPETLNSQPSCIANGGGVEQMIGLSCASRAQSSETVKLGGWLMFRAGKPCYLDTKR